MMPGFTQVDSERFYRDSWPRIKQLAREAHLRRRLDDPLGDYPVVAKSNWDEVKACSESDVPAPPLVIYWGFKDETGTGKTVLAISRATTGNPDEHWVAPELILT